MSKSVKIGIIGAGSMLRYHIEGFRRAGAEVITLSDASLDFATRAAHAWAVPRAFITFTTGQVLSLQISWAEMIKREEVSVTFQGRKAGGKIERLFGIDGVDETSIDTCELYTHENGRQVNRSIIPPRCEDMGRSESAANFIRSLRGDEPPLNTPDQALKLMRIIDAIYASAETRQPISLSAS